MTDRNRPLRLGMHTYTLHFFGLGESWGFEMCIRDRYLEYHRGTYTSQAYNKKTNRRLENKLARTEWLSSLSYILGGNYAQQELNKSWECVLLHQFHDIIPGLSLIHI